MTEKANLNLRHVYHYHAESYNSGNRIQIDGIVQCSVQITNMSSYREVKASIVGSSKCDSDWSWSITSLSYLGAHMVGPEGNI